MSTTTSDNIKQLLGLDSQHDYQIHTDITPKSSTLIFTDHQSFENHGLVPQLLVSAVTMMCKFFIVQEAMITIAVQSCEAKARLKPTTGHSSRVLVPLMYRVCLPFLSPQKWPWERYMKGGSIWRSPGFYVEQVGRCKMMNI